MTDDRIVRPREAQKILGDPSSTLYERIDGGLVPPPIHIGKYTRGWLSSELQAIVAARASGKDESFIKELVLKLIARRRRIFDEFESLMNE